MRTAGRDALVLAAALATGCGTFSTYQTAEPLARGRWQLAAAVTPGVFVDTPSEVTTPTAIGELAVRRGVGGDADVGLKLFSAGAELSARHRFVDADWQWAVLGALAWARSDERAGTTEALYGQLRLSLAATRRTSARWAFTVGPSVGAAAYDFAGGGSATGTFAGGFANAAWTFGAARSWHLIPELSLHATLTGDVPVDGFVTMLGVAIARDL